MMTKHTEQLSTYKALMLDTEAIELLKKYDGEIPSAVILGHKFYQLAKSQGVIK